MNARYTMSWGGQVIYVCHDHMVERSRYENPSDRMRCEEISERYKALTPMECDDCRKAPINNSALNDE